LNIAGGLPRPQTSAREILFLVGLRVRHADETNISPAKFQTSNAPLDQWSANTVINDANWISLR